jgi:LCP family protein required for cell wall assembly
MAGTRRGALWGPAGKLGYGVFCAAAAIVLAVSGSSYFVVHDVASIGGSHAIVSGPSIGAQNILVMGLESRTDWNGNILPNTVLNVLHAGSANGVEYEGVGGNDTNTLILIHIFAGGTKAVGFSIPRDDWVNFADTIGSQQTGKIDQAYGVSMFYREGQLRQQDPHMTKDQIAFAGNEAGRAAAVATVEQLTGVHIDHFAEVNLDGFYELAKVFGGVNVCLLHATQDTNSGANFHAGYQHLDAEQALAFVRQRDNLPNGDLDRTHRQQAFIDSVMHQLHSDGVLSDLTKVNALLSVAKQYVITDSGWNLLDFIAEMRGLSSDDLVFHTLPITGYETIDGQDANAVNPAYIKQIVHNTFFPAPAVTTPHTSSPASTQPAALPDGNVTVSVLNGGQTPGLAGQVSAALVQLGYQTGQVADATATSTTTVEYGSGAQGNASKIASAFGVSASASSSLPADQIEIVLGSDTTSTPDFSSSSPTPSSSSSTAPVGAPTTGPQGGAVHAVDGVPCVD